LRAYAPTGSEPEKEAAMLTLEDRLAPVVHLACDLAQTGKFEDFAAIERELVAEGFAEGVRSMETPAVMDAITEICVASRNIGARAHTTA
jgi:hypothetical protein